MKPVYHSVYPSFIKLDGGAMFGIIPKPLWQKKIPADEMNRIEMNCRIFYIEIDNRHILIDLGTGDYHDEKFRGRFGLDRVTHPVGESFQEYKQISPDQITDIVLTHLHFDHVGGLGTNDGQTLLYPNATLHLHKKHYEYALNPTPKDRGSFHHQYFKPLIDQLIEKKHVNWLEGEELGTALKTESGYELKFKISHGHTPYQVLPFDESIIYMGDLVPTSHHLHLPWVMGYDMKPGVSSLEKIATYDFIIENNLIMVFDHDKDFWGGKIEKLKEEKYQFTKLYRAESEQFETHKF